MTKPGKYLLAATLCVFASVTVLAHEPSERLSVGGVIAAVGQQQALSSATDAYDVLRGNLSLQPEISFWPTAADELSLKLGLARGEGLNPVSPFVLAPWSADMEAEVWNINGRGRGYLLTAWRMAVGWRSRPA